MADDIVTRLRELMADLLYEPDCDDEGCGDCAWYLVAAAIDEIERLRAEVDLKGYRLDDALDEIDRLRAAGDALAKQITKPCRCVEAHDGAINETCAPCAACFDWEEARRG